MADDFATFQESLSTLVKSFEKKNVLVKLYSDPDSNIVRIYGERSDGVTLAKTKQQVLQRRFILPLLPPLACKIRNNR